MLGNLAARRQGDATTAKRFLTDLAGKLDETAWPYPVVRLLRGEIDESALLKLATDDDKRTEARCYLGLAAARPDEAVVHFRWAKEHGNQNNTEYDIAVVELARMEKK